MSSLFIPIFSERLPANSDILSECSLIAGSSKPSIKRSEMMISSVLRFKLSKRDAFSRAIEEVKAYVFRSCSESLSISSEQKTHKAPMFLPPEEREEQTTGPTFDFPIFILFTCATDFFVTATSNGEIFAPIFVPTVKGVSPAHPLTMRFDLFSSRKKITLPDALERLTNAAGICLIRFVILTSAFILCEILFSFDNCSILFSSSLSTNAFFSFSRLFASASFSFTSERSPIRIFRSLMSILRSNAFLTMIIT